MTAVTSAPNSAVVTSGGDVQTAVAQALIALLVVEANGTETVVMNGLPQIAVAEMIQQATVSIAGSGPQGGQGIQGVPGPDGGTFQLIAGIDLDSPRIVAVANGHAYYPDLSNIDDVQRVIGVTTQAAVAGQPINVATQSTFTEPMWNWAPGPIYCSENTGQLTQTIANSAVLEVGTAVDPKTISILIQRAILRAAQ